MQLALTLVITLEIRSMVQSRGNQTAVFQYFLCGPRKLSKTLTKNSSLISDITSFNVARTTKLLTGDMNLYNSKLVKLKVRISHQALDAPCRP